MRAIGDPGISEWGNPPARVFCAEFIGAGGEPGELKHLSSRRNRHQHGLLRKQRPGDSVSSGERTRNRPVARAFGTGSAWNGGPQRVTAPYGKPEPVSSSRAGHVQSCLKTGGPPSKPKYSSVTDSAPVPCGKGEKHPDEGSETVPETGCLQAVGGPGVRNQGSGVRKPFLISDS